MNNWQEREGEETPEWWEFCKEGESFVEVQEFLVLASEVLLLTSTAEVNEIHLYGGAPSSTLV